MPVGMAEPARKDLFALIPKRQQMHKLNSWSPAADHTVSATETGIVADLVKQTCDSCMLIEIENGKPSNTAKKVSSDAIGEGLHHAFPSTKGFGPLPSSQSRTICPVGSPAAHSFSRSLRIMSGRLLKAIGRLRVQ